MPDILNFVDHVFERAERFQQIGRTKQAIALWKKLARLPDLNTETAEEVELRLTEQAIQEERYRAARRHAKRALRVEPQSARGHFLAGLAWSRGRNRNAELALASFQRSLEIAPWQIRCRSEAGLLQLRMGRIEDGLAQLREAVERAPTELAPLRRLIRGLVRCRMWEEARKELGFALFRNPRDSRFKRYRAAFEIRQLQRKQRGIEYTEQEDEGPVLLPFVNLNEEIGADCGVRTDAAHEAEGPHFLKMGRKSRRRQP